MLLEHPDHEKPALQRAILLACKSKALTMAAIEGDRLVSPFVERYGSADVRRFVRALAQSTLLFQSGRTTATVYRSTAAAKHIVEG